LRSGCRSNPSCHASEEAADGYRRFTDSLRTTKSAEDGVAGKIQERLNLYNQEIELIKKLTAAREAAALKQIGLDEATGKITGAQAATAVDLISVAHVAWQRPGGEVFTTEWPIPSAIPFEDHVRAFATWSGNLASNIPHDADGYVCILRSKSNEVLSMLPPPPTPEKL
jgi:hypothetical protein